ncbi:MAG: hypothetical protein K2J76_05715, partial [Oscillospiraceae bacterium]|nr:hypothetical protein [Oscillospiraceae bacterium]
FVMGGGFFGWSRLCISRVRKICLRDVTEHRILLSAKAKAAGIEPSDVIRDISARTPAPRI